MKDKYQLKAYITQKLISSDRSFEWVSPRNPLKVLLRSSSSIRGDTSS